MKNATEQQATKLVATLVEHNKFFTGAPADQVQWAIQNPVGAVSLFCSALRNRANGNPKSEVSNSIIHIDRSIKPAYPPGWVKRLLHPELELTGPAEYDAAKLEQWLHNGQKNGKCIKGWKIFKYLKNNNMLESCLDLSDLLTIQTKDIAFFRQHFVGKTVFGWKSVVQSYDGNLYAPYLFEYSEQVLQDWCWLERNWYGHHPALRFAS